MSPFIPSLFPKGMVISQSLVIWGCSWSLGWRFPSPHVFPEREHLIIMKSKVTYCRSTPCSGHENSKRVTSHCCLCQRSLSCTGALYIVYCRADRVQNRRRQSARKQEVHMIYVGIVVTQGKVLHCLTVHKGPFGQVPPFFTSWGYVPFPPYGKKWWVRRKCSFMKGWRKWKVKSCPRQM